MNQPKKQPSQPAGSSAASVGKPLSGGFWRYRCKNFFTHNCLNWVYVHKEPCAICMAYGRY